MTEPVDLAARRAAMNGLGQLLADAMQAEYEAVVEWSIDRPGVYADVPEQDYLRDPVQGGSLSSHGARLLLPPSCPAMFHWRKTHPRPDKPEFDFGHAVHSIVLGVGAEVVELKFPDWRTNAAKDARDQARRAGKVPLLPEAYARVQGAANAITNHPLASRLFDPEHGDPEQTLVWQDEDTGVWCRARLDWQPDPGHLSRFLVTDLKTADSADKGAFSRSAATYGYAQQAAWYIDGVTTLGLDDDPAFLFVAVEKDPPHLINIIQLDDPSIDAGRVRNRAALNIYRRCTETGEWPGYSDDVELVSLPNWYLNDPTLGET